MATPAKSTRLRMHVEIERATLHDVSGLQAILLASKRDTSLLQRRRQDILRNLRDFLLATGENGRLLGCAALHFHDEQTAEVLSLAVMPEAQGKGIGPRLLEECERIATQRGARRLFLMTAQPAYFARLRYRRVSRFRLPRRVLLAKSAQLLEQSPSRWIPGLLWRFTFMEKRQ